MSQTYCRPHFGAYRRMVIGFIMILAAGAFLSDHPTMAIFQSALGGFLAGAGFTQRLLT